MRSRHFNVLELITAMVLLGVITMGVVSAVSASGRARVRMTQQARAILVLENTITRLETRTAWTQAGVEAVMADELAAVTMPRDAGIAVGSELVNGGLQLRVTNADDQRLAVVLVPLGAPQ